MPHSTWNAPDDEGRRSHPRDFDEFRSSRYRFVCRAFAEDVEAACEGTFRVGEKIALTLLCFSFRFLHSSS